MAPNQHEGTPDEQATTIVNTAGLLRLLGQVPGGLADRDAVILAAQAHGIDLSAQSDVTAGHPVLPAESYPYRDGARAGADDVQFIEDDRPVLGADDRQETAFRNVRDRGQGVPGQAGRQGWPGNGWRTAGRPAGADHHLIDQGSPQGYLGAPADTAVTAAGDPVDKWAVPAYSYLADQSVAETETDGRLYGDQRLQRQLQRHPNRRRGLRLGPSSIAVITVTALAAAFSGGAVYLNHKKHVDFNHSVQNTLVVPDYIPQGTEASNELETDIPALQQALVDPAISALRGSNTLQANRLYNGKLGALPLAILLQVGGGDPQTSGYPGIVWPLPPNVYQQDYKALVASEQAHGEAVSPNDPNNPSTDALVVSLDMNDFFARHYQPGDTPSVSDLARAYGAFEAQRLGAPAKGAADFGQSTANLVTQWYLTQAQYKSLPKNGQQFAALAIDPTWLKHEGAVANRGT